MEEEKKEDTNIKNKTKQILMLFDGERDLTKYEYANLSEKINSGTIPVEYLRKNLFNSTMTKSFEYQTGRKKLLYEDDKVKVSVNRSLNLKHRDVLSILFTDNKGIKEKPNSKGEYIIKTNLYHIAKEMDYKNPGKSTTLIKNFLYDLRNTELTFYDKINKIEYGGHRIIGEYKWEEETNDYTICIPATTAKKHILGYSVEIPKVINQKILKIPNSLSKLKSLISYIISNKALKNGISFDNLCDKLEIETPSSKSKFKKLILDNLNLLKDFNISFSENQIIKYTQLEDIVFHSPVQHEMLLDFLDTEDTKSKIKENQDEEYKIVKNIFINGTIIHNAVGGGHEKSIIENIKKVDGGYKLILEGGIEGKNVFDYNYLMKLRTSNYFRPFGEDLSI